MSCLPLDWFWKCALKIHEPKDKRRCQPHFRRTAFYFPEAVGFSEDGRCKGRGSERGLRKGTDGRKTLGSHSHGGGRCFWQAWVSYSWAWREETSKRKQTGRVLCNLPSSHSALLSTLLPEWLVFPTVRDILRVKIQIPPHAHTPHTTNKAAIWTSTLTMLPGIIRW